MSEKLLPIPLLGGLALQFDPASVPWATYLGIGAIVMVALIIALDKIGLLKKFGNGGEATARAQMELKNSTDALAKKVDQLNATMNSQVMILGNMTAELKETTKAVGDMHKWAQVQEGVRQRMEGGG